MSTTFHQSLFDWCTAENSPKTHRQVAISVDVDQSFIDQLHASTKSILVFSSKGLKQSIQPSSQAMLNVLGNHYDIVIYDASNGINANILYGASGLVKKAGHLILFVDRQLLSATPTNPQTIFQHHVLRKFQQLSVCSIFLPDEVKTTSLVTADAKYHYNDSLSGRQQQILDAIVSKTIVSDQHISVILGDRGRGKSTLLAHAIAKLLEQGRQVIFTAPHRQNCQCIFDYLNDNQIIEAEFKAPDELVSTKYQANYVLVIDEVASIAPRIFTQMRQMFSHIVCAGTVQGYEGSAKGFVIRRLSSICSDDIYHLQEPFRWHKDDPIEVLFTELFGCPVDDVSDFEQFDINLLKTSLLNKQQVLSSQPLYRTVTGLLAQAHYNTTPQTIQRLFEDSSHVLISLHDNNICIGIAVLVNETIDASHELKQDISRGRRRTKGQLFTQSLAKHLIDSRVLDYNFSRIHRIVVHPALQRNSIGSIFLDKIKHNHIKQNNILCTVFGLTYGLYEFWRLNGFALIKVGQRIDSASGTVSGFFIDKQHFEDLDKQFFLSDKLAIDIHYIRYIQTRLRDYLPAFLFDKEPESNPALSQQSIARIEGFISENIFYDMVKADVFALACNLNDRDLHACIAMLAQKGISKEQRLTTEKALMQIVKTRLNDGF